MSYIIYTDGACSGNPGPGGWAWVCLAGGQTCESYGGEKCTTNNKMELTAAIESLKAIKSRLLNQGKKDSLVADTIELRTDSQYVKNGISAWIKNWKKNSWKTASKSPVKNKELWMELDLLSSELKVKYTWVEGHNGEVWNERCDSLARKGVLENS